MRTIGVRNFFVPLKSPPMFLVLIAWLYVTLLMGIAEASAPNGTVLGGIVTFVLYGLIPAAIVGYILATPARKRALRARREAEAAASPPQPDAGSHAPGAAEAGAVAPVGKEP